MNWRFPLVLLSLPMLVLAQEPELKPYVIDWSKAEQSAIDLSGFLQAPAGKDGFLRVKDGKIARPDGSRFRIWGVNICGPACFPDKDKAPLIAGDLARMGINVVRFHHMDSNWGRSAIDMKRTDTRQLSVEDVDRFDCFVNELKKRGIYSNINLNVLRKFKEGDGVRDFKILGIGKGATYFNPRLIELQQEYARQMLTHKNAYTGNEYRNEPAVAVVEMVNENSLTEAWCQSRLVGRDDKAGDTWSPIPVSYSEELTDQFNAWLAKNVSKETLAAIRKEAGVDEQSGRVPRLLPNQFAKASRDRFHAEAKFLMETEVAFFTGMKKLLKEELGVKSMLVGSADHNDWVSGYPHIKSNMVFDFIDGHGYWEHPRIAAETWIKNTPMVNDPLDSTFAQFARTPVAGLPFTISEVNHPYPHKYAAEGYPILTAYALLHDWDGIYWFDYGEGRNGDPARRGLRNHGWFDFSNDPVKMTNVYACGLLWHRQDVKMAPTLITRAFTNDQVIESLRMDQGKNRPYFTPGFAITTALQMRTRLTFEEGAKSSEFPERGTKGKLESETGELKWLDADQKKGVVILDSPRSSMLIGFLKENPRATRHLSAEVTSAHCAIVLTSLDGLEIADASRLLLAVTARSGNTGMAFKEDGQTLAQWGKGPTVIEPVTGTVSIKDLRGVKGIKATALTAEGRPIGAPVPVEQGAHGWKIGIGTSVTTWYVVEMMR